MTVLVDSPPPAERRVRIWFGEQIIADYTAEVADAVRYQASMTRRFASLRITIEPAYTAVDDDAANS